MKYDGGKVEYSFTVQTFTSEATSSVSRLAIAQVTANSVSTVGIIITRQCFTETLINICISER